MRTELRALVERKRSVVVCPGGDGGSNIVGSQCVDSVVRERSVVVCPGGDGGSNIVGSQFVDSVVRERSE